MLTFVQECSVKLKLPKDMYAKIKEQEVKYAKEEEEVALRNSHCTKEIVS